MASSTLAGATLRVDDADVEQGTILHFTYAAPTEKVSDKNWVGLYPSGSAPGAIASPAWTYAPGSGGTVEINSGEVAPGGYSAYLLYDDGYDALAGPLPVAVRATRELPAPAYVGSFGRRLGGPAGMTRDEGGNLWVADPPTRSVHQYDARGRLVRIVESSHLVDPQDVAVGDGELFVVDAARERIEVFTLTARRLRTMGTGSLLKRPRGLEYADGQLLVADAGHNRVVRMDAATGKPVGTITRDIHIPHGIAADPATPGRTWVVSSSRQYDGNEGVTSYVADAPTITLGYGQHSTFGGLSNPAHVAVAGDLVYVSVPDFGFVSRFRSTGAFVGEFGTDGAGLLRYPQGVLAAGGLVHVADTGNRRIAIFREQA